MGVNLDTGTLTTSNLSNTKNSRNISLGGSSGTTVTANLALGSENSKSKTLATITKGNITVRDKKNLTDITKLNRNKDDINLDLYDVKSDVSIKAEVDTNILTKDGRNKIKRDLEVTADHGADIGNAIKEVATNEKLDITNLKDKLQDNFSSSRVKDYLIDTKEGQKIAQGLKADPNSKEYQDAKVAYMNKYQKVRGLEKTKVMHYDAKNSEQDLLKDINDAIDTQGATLTQGENKGTIVLDVSGDKNNQHNKELDNQVAGHELGESRYQQEGNGTFFKDSYNTKEEMNDQLGNRLTQRLNEATSGALKNTTYTTSTNSYVKSQASTVNKLDVRKNGVEYRQVTNKEIKFINEHAKDYAKEKLGKDTVTSAEIENARRELATTAVSLVDNKYKETVKDTSKQAQEYLEKNVDSIKNVTEIEKASSGIGIKNIANNEENLEFYKTNIHPNVDKNLKEVVNEKIQTATNDTLNKLKVIEEQGALKTVENAKDKVVDYYKDNTFNQMREDVKKAVLSIADDMQKGTSQITNISDATPEEIAKVYNISKEDAIQAKNAIMIIAASSVSGIVKNTFKGVVDLGINKKPNTALHEKINERAQQEEIEKEIGFKTEKVVLGKKLNEAGQKAHNEGPHSKYTYQKEFNDKDFIKEGILPGNQKEGTISRLHNNEDVPDGNYLAITKQIDKAKNKNELTQNYSLPPSSTVKYTTYYKGLNDKKVILGPVGKNDFGKGSSNTQLVVKLKDDKKLERNEFHKKTQRLTKD